MQNSLVIAGIALLAAGTYAIRFAGYRLGSRMHMSERAQHAVRRGYGPAAGCGGHHRAV